jgi:DNA mismatch endonuclease (patch repair protein)
MMSGIKGKTTKPEIIVRKALFKRGFRYRLHSKGLPGKPDLVFPMYRAVIFVNGCFWHGHECHLFKWPKSNPEFWKEKITGNQRRDSKNKKLLEAQGWRVITIWECSLKGASPDDIEIEVDKLSLWLTSE